MVNKDFLSDELLATFLEGNTSKEETRQVLRQLNADPQLREVLDVAMQVDDDLSVSARHVSLPNKVLPMLQIAAVSRENICAVLCEQFILHRRHLPCDEDWLIKTARENDWLKPEGTPLYCLGNLLEYSGLHVSRKYDATLDDIKKALLLDNDVVVGVDREKLYPGMIDLEDLTNHAVVVTHIDNDTVTIFDPHGEPTLVNVPQTDFLNAWRESHNYMILVLPSVEEKEI